MSLAASPTRPKSVLIVDDEPSVLMTLAANLELAGYDVTEASSGEEALALAKERSFDVVLSDVCMPGMHGVDLYRAFRKLASKSPVILMTAFAKEQLLAEGIEEGIYAVVQKPYPMDCLIRLLDRASHRKAILVVDDESSFTQGLVASLEAVGVTATEVQSGEEALAVVQRESVDICLVDLIMPQMTGPELCRHVTATDPEVGVVTMTGQDGVTVMAEAFRNGCRVCLKKPFSTGALLRAIVGVRRQLGEQAPVVAKSTAFE